MEKGGAVLAGKRKNGNSQMPVDEKFEESLQTSMTSSRKSKPGSAL
jgi:hypothetical protein